MVRLGATNLNNLVNSLITHMNLGLINELTKLNNLANSLITQMTFSGGPYLGLINETTKLNNLANSNSSMPHLFNARLELHSSGASSKVVG